MAGHQRLRLQGTPHHVKTSPGGLRRPTGLFALIPNAMRDDNVIIIANPGDLHTFLVAEALQRKKIPCEIVHTTDFPSQLTISLSISEDDPTWDVSGPELTLSTHRFRSLWFRRPCMPVIPELVHPADKPFAGRESQKLAQALWYHLAPAGFWVNSLERSAQANDKAYQLRAARRVGFKIPRTLCSNDPQSIRGFIRSCGGVCIYKPFVPVTWRTTEGFAPLFTNTVAEDDLPPDELLSAAPGIFQPLVPKSYELRVTVIGCHVFAAKIFSQETSSGLIDWRAELASVRSEQTELPLSVSAACIKLLRDLGLAFGCLDFIVTPDHQYIFLEVNEMGQFLWLESENPDMLLLDAFSELLIQARVDFNWSASTKAVRLADVEKAAKDRKAAAALLHVPEPARDEWAKEA
jgi:hypothetical protein